MCCIGKMNSLFLSLLPISSHYLNNLDKKRSAEEFLLILKSIRSRVSSFCHFEPKICRKLEDSNDLKFITNKKRIIISEF